jgi:hypothetical protein
MDIGNFHRILELVRNSKAAAGKLSKVVHVDFGEVAFKYFRPDVSDDTVWEDAVEDTSSGMGDFSLHNVGFDISLSFHRFLVTRKILILRHF